MKIPVFDVNGKETEKIDLPGIFDTKINQALLAQAVRVYLANQRQGTAKTKTRGEVEGSTRKIYKQKGTGHARHGSNRAPIFRKGGIAFGPQPREYRLDLPQKMRKAALISALVSKIQDNTITVIDGLDKVSDKTKEMVKVFRNLKLKPDEEKILFVLDKTLKNILLAARNIDNTTITGPNFLTAYNVLNNKKVLFTKDAILSLGSKQEAINNKQAEVSKASKVSKVPNEKALKIKKVSKVKLKIGN